MSFFTKKKILITHNGTFHADDLFASAVLSILNNGNIKIIRTRNPEVIKKGDYVYDVGGEYDPLRNVFDHHQKGGSGSRENGIPYASFGLVWKTYGEKICGSKEVADKLDVSLVSAIDAVDNGVDVVKPVFNGVLPYGIQQYFLNQIPSWNESNQNIDKIFNQQVKEVCKFLKREIQIAKSDVDGSNIILDAYNKSEDKRIVVLDKDFPRYLFQGTLSKLVEPMYLIYPSAHGDTWKVEAISKNPETIESRKLFPESWRGFMNSDPKLGEITGVLDIIFTHRSGFYMNVKSLESARILAQKALLA